MNRAAAESPERGGGEQVATLIAPVKLSASLPGECALVSPKAKGDHRPQTMASAVSHKGGSDAHVRSQLRPDCHTQSSK